MSSLTDDEVALETLVTEGLNLARTIERTQNDGTYVAQALALALRAQDADSGAGYLRTVEESVEFIHRLRTMIIEHRKWVSRKENPQLAEETRRCELQMECINRAMECHANGDAYGSLLNFRQSVEIGCEEGEKKVQSLAYYDASIERLEDWMARKLYPPSVGKKTA